MVLDERQLFAYGQLRLVGGRSARSVEPARPLVGGVRLVRCATAGVVAVALLPLRAGNGLHGQSGFECLQRAQRLLAGSLLTYRRILFDSRDVVEITAQSSSGQGPPRRRIGVGCCRRGRQPLTVTAIRVEGIPARRPWFGRFIQPDIWYLGPGVIE